MREISDISYLSIEHTPEIRRQIEIYTANVKCQIAEAKNHVTNFCSTEYWYRHARAAPIFIDWIVECISHYRLFPLMSYNQMLSPQKYYAIGYPREIVGNEEYSDTSN